MAKQRKIAGLQYPGPGEPDPPCNGYVVYHFTRYQDGHEEGCTAFEKLDDALAYMTKAEDGMAMHRFELFELGRRVPVEWKTEEVETVTRTQTKRAVVAPNATAAETAALAIAQATQQCYICKRMPHEGHDSYCSRVGWGRAITDPKEYE